MKTVTFNALSKVENKDKSSEVVAFQVVLYVIDYFGSVVEGSFDTKILRDGRQLVIDGDGFFKSGEEVMI